MKQHKKKIIFGAIIIAVLAFAFWYGGNAPGLRGWSVQPKGDITASDNAVSVVTDSPVEAEQTTDISEPDTAVTLEQPSTDIAEEPSDTAAEEKDEPAPAPSGMVIDETTGKDRYLTDPVPEGKPIPVEPQEVTVSENQLTCTLSVRCDTILANMDWLDKDKVEIVPPDGVIYAERTVIFYEGESVFDVLLREMRQNKIHMEFEHTPMYNSAYIEGIANLYEFDCGELSGWMYKVNGWFPNYGCSRYQLKAGDKIEWVYTCDLGADVGGRDATGGNR